MKQPAELVHMSLSADHKWLAYCIQGESRGSSIGVSMAVEGIQQWVCEIETGSCFQVIPEAKSSWAGVWSPDGMTLAFYADMNKQAQLWLWSIPNRTLKLASDRTARPFFGFEKPIWLADSKRIIMKAMPQQPLDNDFFYTSTSTIDVDSEKRSDQPLVFSTKPQLDPDKTDFKINTWFNRYQADLYIVNYVTGEELPLCLGRRPVGMQLSSDGEHFAFTSCQGEELANSQQNIYDLWVCSINENSIPICIAHNIRLDYGLSFAWSNDKQRIYYTTNGPLADRALWAAELLNPNHPQLIGQPENIQLGYEFDYPVILPKGDLLLVAQGSLWRYSSVDGQFMKVLLDCEVIAVLPQSGDTSTIVVQIRKLAEGVEGFWEIDHNSWEVKRVIEDQYGHLPWFEGGAVYSSENGRSSIAYIRQQADMPPEIRIVNLLNEQASTISLSAIRKENLGSSELITWNSKDKDLKGALLLPQNPIDRVPVIIRVYGGSMQSRYYRNFGLSNANADNHHLFASQGFGVFMPDLPMRQSSHEPVDEIVHAIEIAVQALLKHPLVDPDRIGIIGHSFGGYSALAALTRLPYFKAAVISAGISSLVSFYTHFDYTSPASNYGWVEGGQVNLGASLWEDRERYIRNSPLFDLDRIESPVLIIQGSRDHLCRHEAGPIFSSLNRLSKTAELVIYEEDHWQGTWGRANQEDYYHRVVSWFSKYL
ncbi:S9 family peptidase [Paenibacillus albiflavus]|uniref:S9 family peptidase n=1 Tax=Paenibacillus albiflavus TaxID=2545760 RepID=UPI00104FD355|nr:alpha/beta fold hydrolase [Paenibacillus albiflavus]